MSDKIDYSKDEFQGCNHYGVLTSASTGVNGVPRAERVFYAVAKNPDQALSESVSKCRCLNCEIDNLDPSYIYCPNCGRLFL